MADGSREPVGVDQPAEGRFAFPESAQRAAAYDRDGVATGLEVAFFGGACFWGMQELLRQAPGAVSTEVGYAGGTTDSPTYEEVSSGSTGHAQSVKVVFDPGKTTYEKLVLWFFRIHDPTTPNRQGHDVGSQYRSVIFYQSPERAMVADAVKVRLDRSRKLPGPVVTQVVPTTKFHRAEAYHQDYPRKHPGGYTCHFVRPDLF
jgi:methionine-S-sulfoxide reductase